MRVPTKLALRLNPGEYLMDGEDAALILLVAYETARDVVTVKTAQASHRFRLHDRVAVMPRDE